MKRVFVGIYLLAATVPLAWLGLRSGNGEGGFVATLLRTGADSAGWGGQLRILVDAVLAALLAITLATPAAFALARARFVGRRGVIVLLALARACSPLVVGLGAAECARRSDLAAAAWLAPVAQLAFTLPIAVWILTVALARVPADLVEATRFDRLGPLHAARLVTWPWLGPALTWAALASVAASLLDAGVAPSVRGLSVTEGDCAVRAARGLWSCLPALALGAVAATVLRRRTLPG